MTLKNFIYLNLKDGEMTIIMDSMHDTIFWIIFNLQDGWVVI